MPQVHSKFKVLIVDGPVTQHALDQFSADLGLEDIAPKSVGVEYLEARDQTVLSVGYSDDESYPINLELFNMGKVEITPEAISVALEDAADRNDDVLCHEFFMDRQDNLFVVLMTMQG